MESILNSLPQNMPPKSKADVLSRINEGVFRSFTGSDSRDFYKERPGGIFSPLLRKIRIAGHRIAGRFSFEDQITIACMCEPPMFFLKHGCLVPHPYGVTLSADFIGADCCIGQVATIGTNQRYMRLGDNTDGHKPRIGHLVRIYSNTTISGEISIGSFSLIASGAIVTRDVPPLTIVYGRNEFKPLELHHFEYLRALFHLSHFTYHHVAGLVYSYGDLLIDKKYRDFCQELKADVENKERFSEALIAYAGSAGRI